MEFASRLILCTLLVAAGFAADPAYAQWMWKDDGGHIVASDQPPPTSVPLSRILKSPRQRVVDVTPTPPAKDGEPKDASKTDTAKADASRANPAKSVADRELEFKQRQKESAEANQKTDAEATKAKAMQENCTAVRGNLAGLQNGGRAARVNEKGEKSYIDDAQRQSEIAKSQSQIAQYCK